MVLAVEFVVVVFLVFLPLHVLGSRRASGDRGTPGAEASLAAAGDCPVGPEGNPPTGAELATAACSRACLQKCSTAWPSTGRA